MSLVLRALAAIMLSIVALLGWGYWRSSTHASLNLRIEDEGLRTERQRYGSPHPATIELLDDDGAILATVKSIEPLGYFQAFHPNPDIQSCGQYDGYDRREHYARCFAVHSRWVAGWAPRVRRARVTVGECRLEDVPVAVSSSNADWWLWWVPLPHVGGTPLGYFEMSVAIDSKSCTVVKRG